MNNDYLNQEMWGQDTPPENLITPKSEPAEVRTPFLFNLKWAVWYFQAGQPYPSVESFDSGTEALDWAKWKAQGLGVKLSQFPVDKKQ